MSLTLSPCQFQNDQIIAASAPRRARQFGSDLIWKIQRIFGVAPAYFFPGNPNQTSPDSSLGLSAGERVQIRELSEIELTLDGEGRLAGLLFMPEMKIHCGQEFLVFKRVERVLLECSGNLRGMKNTVLLENSICDGILHYGCNRSCFFFWKEAWLRRAAEPSSLHQTTS